MSTCSHINELFVPQFSVAVHKEECCTCFNGQDPELNGTYAPDALQTSSLWKTKHNYPQEGHNICLTCFTGGCFTPRGHMFHHHEVTKHHVVLNIVKHVDHYQAIEIDPSSVQSLGELALNVQQQQQQQKQPQYTYLAYCISCDAAHQIDPSLTPTLHASLQFILNADNATTLIEAKSDDSSLNLSAFDEKPTPCPHTAELEDGQMETGAINFSCAIEAQGDGDGDDDAPLALTTATGTKLFLHENGLPDLAHATKPPNDDEMKGYIANPPQHNIYKCQDCDIHSNLWLCMTCGYLGCARRDYDGSGGNNHAVEHSETTGHPLVVKIATVTKDTGDIWCYSCSKAVLDNDLSSHLQSFNIDTSALHQTEMNLAEMQLQMNITAQFAAAYNEDGVCQPLVFGHGYTGIQNRGNSCYLSSILQCMLRTPLWKERYWKHGVSHVQTCRNNRPGQCYLCNMYKLADGLFSATYSSYPSDNGLVSFITSQHAKITSLQAQQTGSDDDKANPDAIIDHSRKKVRLSSADQMTDGDGDVDGNENVVMGDSQLTQPSSQSAGTTSTTTAIIPSIELQHGVSIFSTRKLLCDKHPIFGNNLQQCAYEFLCHLREKVKDIEKSLPATQGFSSTAFPSASSLLDPFAFKTLTVKLCSSCGKTTANTALQYDLNLNFEPTPSAHDPDAQVCDFATCLKLLSQPTVLEGYKCPGCSLPSTTSSRTTILTTPQYLVVQMKRFVIDTTTWSVAKSNVSILNTNEITLAPVVASQDTLALATGNISQDSGPVEDPAMKETVEMMHEMSMAPRCLIRQLLAKCGNNPDGAMEMLFMQESMEHTDTCTCPDNPMAAQQQTAPTNQGNPLQETAGGLDHHVGSHQTSHQYQLVSFVNHLGTNTNNGHYVAHIRSDFNHSFDSNDHINPLLSASPSPQEPVQFEPLKIASHSQLTADSIKQECITPLSPSPATWVCFNDNKVFVNSKPPNDQAYVYIFQRKAHD